MKNKVTAPLILLLTLAGCAGNPPVQPPSTAGRAGQGGEPQAAGHSPAQAGLPGRYSAPRVSGDYAGYRALDEFIQRMEAKHGFPRDYLNGLFSRARRKQWTLDYLAREAGPSVATPRPGAWSRYRAKFLTEQHISGGVQFWRSHREALQRASEQYGVPPEYIVGILGVETLYGRNVGNHRVIDALTTLAFDYPRRASYFREELENYLLMASAENVDPLQWVGSYAGAMGFGQFMPGSFLQWSVDFDGDGHRNLWHPDDAIGSVANYFAQHGWRRGDAVAAPARVSNANVQNLEAGYDRQYAVADLIGKGLQPTHPVPPGEPVRLLRLRANSGDEYWLGQQNFYVITRYNHSTHYAMAVHQLAQAVKQRYQGESTASR